MTEDVLFDARPQTTVFLNNGGGITIAQDTIHTLEHESSVYFDASDIDTLCHRLQVLKQEILNPKKDAEVVDAAA